MDKKRGEIEQREQMERAAEERRREIDSRRDESHPDPTGQFNAVEGVAPHGAGIPDKNS